MLPVQFAWYTHKVSVSLYRCNKYINRDEIFLKKETRPLLCMKTCHGTMPSDGEMGPCNCNLLMTKRLHIYYRPMALASPRPDQSTGVSCCRPATVQVVSSEDEEPSWYTIRW
jgi:hypothetical protein